MAKNKVGIPVEVQGGQQAQQELREVGQAVQQTGAAGAKAKQAEAQSLRDAARASAEELKAKIASTAASAQNLRIAEALSLQKGHEAQATRFAALAVEEEAKLASLSAVATKGAAKSALAFKDEALTMSTALLGLVNPQLGAMAGLAGNVARACPRSIALGGIVTIWQRITEAAKEAEEAQRRALEATKAARDTLLDRQNRIAGTLHGAGVFGRGPETVRAAERIQRTIGVSEELADFAAAAQAISGIGDDQLDELLAGRLVTGGEGGWIQRSLFVGFDHIFWRSPASLPRTEASRSPKKYEGLR